jgi:hypothetical protein
MIVDEDEIRQVLSDLELSEYLCFLLEYIEALLEGFADQDDAKYCYKDYVPDHPVMRSALDIYSHH